MLSPSADQFSSENDREKPPRYLLFLRWIDDRLRPALGWGVLLLTILLVLMPVQTVFSGRWVRGEQMRTGLTLLGLASVLVGWWLAGWRADRLLGRFRLLHLFVIVFDYLLIGVLLASQFLIGWLPSPLAIGRAITNGDWASLLTRSQETLWQAGQRYELWRQGLASSTATQDDLILACLAGVILWLIAGMAVLVVRRAQNGMLAALPILLPICGLLFWGQATRPPLILALVVTLLLHLWLHQEKLRRRWEATNLDYSTSLVLDRLMAAFAAGAIVFSLAALMPNLYITPIAQWYYDLTAPFNRRMEAARELIFPELKVTSRWRGFGGGGGLPNDFLLGSGPELGHTIVMTVRTNEASSPMPEDAPPGHYMRALTLSEYDGRGWSNRLNLGREDVPADQRWREEEMPGRQPLVQSVTMLAQSPLLFAAAEPVEVSVASEVELAATGDAVSLRSWESRYTVVSAIPAIGEETLFEAGEWGDLQPLPAEVAIYLQLPSQISDRTRQLAAEIVADQVGLYDNARAIETYLRQFPYDLQVSAPPADVLDVTDYFLFDLQRGYCDYYATAFVVLARLSGIPARLATGYAVGGWNPYEMQWTITEAEAHSWPEVFFPHYGWIAFEPTAGRSPLDRTELQRNDLSISPGLPQSPSAETNGGQRWQWNWQMLFWLLPVAGLGWALVEGWRYWQKRRLDPWLALLRWGARDGNPMQEGDTILGYGERLAEILRGRAEGTLGKEEWRSVAREVAALSEAVSIVRYAPEAARLSATQKVAERWERLREYL